MLSKEERARAIESVFWSNGPASEFEPAAFRKTKAGHIIFLLTYGQKQFTGLIHVDDRVAVIALSLRFSGFDRKKTEKIRKGFEVINESPAAKENGVRFVLEEKRAQIVLSLSISLDQNWESDEFEAVIYYDKRIVSFLKAIRDNWWLLC